MINPRGISCDSRDRPAIILFSCLVIFLFASAAQAKYDGGLVGHCSPNGIITNCFWDSDINPDVNGVGNGTDPNVTGKPTMEMKKENTFTDWDFVEIWGIGENQTYPFLWVYPAGDLNHSGGVDFEDYAIFAEHWLEGIE